ncbi:MAG: HD domain-containing protein [Pelosinus sp.]|nr:HD domain-containing protein [Pelosinus sp.]
MKRYNIAELQPNMVLAQDVIDEDKSVVLLKSDTVLTETLIGLLRERGITSVPILNKQTVLQKKYQTSVNHVRQIFDEARHSNKLRVNDFQSIAQDCIKDFIYKPHSFSILKELATKDNYTFEHSVNVGILSGLIAHWMNFSKQDIHQAVLAGLFHDIGKAKIPLSILNKPGKLSPEEMAIMQKHASLGYDLVVNLEDIPLSVKMCSLQHHERNNGCGYPASLENNDINKFAKIIAIADVYDAITSDRVYKKKTTPFKAIQIIEEELGKLDPAIGNVFVLNIREYLIGSRVLLNTNECAEIICWNKVIGSLPILRTASAQYIDLNTQKEYQISTMP